MALLVWFTMGIAIWHFAVFVPDRFWGGIVGAFLGAIAGAMATGIIGQLAASRTIGDTSLSTALVAVPGALLGLAAIYVAGVRAERHNPPGA